MPQSPGLLFAGHAEAKVESTSKKFHINIKEGRFIEPVVDDKEGKTMLAVILVQPPVKPLLEPTIVALLSLTT